MHISSTSADTFDDLSAAVVFPPYMGEMPESVASPLRLSWRSPMPHWVGWNRCHSRAWHHRDMHLPARGRDGAGCGRIGRRRPCGMIMQTYSSDLPGSTLVLANEEATR